MQNISLLYTNKLSLSHFTTLVWYRTVASDGLSLSLSLSLVCFSSHSVHPDVPPMLQQAHNSSDAESQRIERGRAGERASGARCSPWGWSEALV